MLDMIRSETHPLDAPLPPPPQAQPADVALFLDLDGTLLDFAARPDAVVVEDGLRTRLRRLRTALGGALALLSGRSLQQIDALLGLPEAAAAGLHGAELRRANGRVSQLRPEAERLEALRDRARAIAAALPGVLLEDKGVAFALHYRNVPDAAPEVERAAHELLRFGGAGFELQAGNRVVELKPAGVDKGVALAALMLEAPFAGRVPWMLGDDLTDEHAFARVEELGGVSILVGERRPTRARHALADPAAARAWLAALADAAATQPMEVR
ncbi:trehalose-phosphatase [Dokdonella sp.]|uniref:trehalose-phosphatase n=1 Tax=Dokdonella sp. TaxID=2291710 RepID=UPI0025C23E25|nr:trehalose-phosphatase [Dokdonella sp.]